MFHPIKKIYIKNTHIIFLNIVSSYVLFDIKKHTVYTMLNGIFHANDSINKMNYRLT